MANGRKWCRSGAPINFCPWRDLNLRPLNWRSSTRHRTRHPLNCCALSIPQPFWGHKDQGHQYYLLSLLTWDINNGHKVMRRQCIFRSDHVADVTFQTALDPIRTKLTFCIPQTLLLCWQRITDLRLIVQQMELWHLKWICRFDIRRNMHRPFDIRTNVHRPKYRSCNWLEE